MSSNSDFIAKTKLNLNGSDLDAFKSIRSQGQQALKALDIPSTREEYWKYTRLNKLSKKPFVQDGKVLDIAYPETFSENVIRIKNGSWETKPIDNEKLKLLPINQVATVPALIELLGTLQHSTEQFFDALNASNFNHGFAIWVKAGHDAGEINIQELFSQEGYPYQQRYLIVLEEGASLKLIQHQSANASAQLLNTLSEIKIHPKANLKIDLIQDLNDDSSMINTIYAEQAEQAHFDIFTASLDAELIRNNLNISVKGEHCETHLNGISLGRGKEHIDHHTVVDHLVPNCNSYENYKGIFYDKATGVFNGKVFVRQDAQKTNAFQQNQNIVMSDDAKVYSKPELEIYADDVKCSHGSTTGQFDEEAVFYLRSRGISSERARSMMVHAFLSELTDNIKNANFKAFLEERIDQKLSKQ